MCANFVANKALLSGPYISQINYTLDMGLKAMGLGRLGHYTSGLGIILQAWAFSFLNACFVKLGSGSSFYYLRRGAFY
jgi:hypothetical protein